MTDKIKKVPIIKKIPLVEDVMLLDVATMKRRIYDQIERTHSIPAGAEVCGRIGDGAVLLKAGNRYYRMRRDRYLDLLYPDKASVPHKGRMELYRKKSEEFDDEVFQIFLV